MRQTSGNTSGRTTATDGQRSDVIALPDGRVFGMRTYGDPKGRPVIALHGTPGSRYKFASAEASAAQFGLRLICLDRWGYGLSSARPGGSLLDFAADIGAVADRLQLARFGVVGISGGAPFAAAIAAFLPERVEALALVSPIGPMCEGVPRPQLSAFHFACFRVLPRIPGAIPLVFQAFRLGLRLAPGSALALANSRAAVDRLAVREQAVSGRLVHTFREGLEPGVLGAQTDMDLFSRPWGIDLERAACPARVWIGTADRSVPIEAARALAARLPRCDMVEIENAGHLWMAHNYAIVMAWLAQTGR